MVPDEMLAGRGHEPGEAAQELGGREEPLDVAVAAGLSQSEGRRAPRSEAEQPPCGVAEEAVTSLVVAGLDAQVGVDIDDFDIDETRAEVRCT
jgi:hypothetical protein